MMTVNAVRILAFSISLLRGQLYPWFLCHYSLDITIGTTGKMAAWWFQWVLLSHVELPTCTGVEERSLISLTLCIVHLVHCSSLFSKKYHCHPAQKDWSVLAPSAQGLSPSHKNFLFNQWFISSSFIYPFVRSLIC